MIDSSQRSKESLRVSAARPLRSLNFLDTHQFQTEGTKTMIIEGSVELILKLCHENGPRAQAALATVQHDSLAAEVSRRSRSIFYVSS